MGMSICVQAFINAQDPTYQKHAKVLVACSEADVSLPKETAEYFGDDSPERYLLEEKLMIEIPIREWNGGSASGYEILVKDIPEGVYKIRFYESW